MITINNATISAHIKDEYSLDDIHRISELLSNKKTLYFPTLRNGLFSAAILEEENEYTGYQAVWVRDNIHVANAHYLCGTDNGKLAAVNAIKSLVNYFHKERSAFHEIIGNGCAPLNQMHRPHIRFNGNSLEKIEQTWNHAQNDALGYFLWLYCRLIDENLLEPSYVDGELLTLFPLYFEAIQYWQDEDSGHWEEEAKIEASSIGSVVAGLRIMRRLLVGKPQFRSTLKSYKGKSITLPLLDELINKGESVLVDILPSESIQAGKERRYDAALLFLIYPLQVVGKKQAKEILEDVVNNLQGEYGISRYRKDSFWCRNYRDMPPSIRTSIASEREEWLETHGGALREGEEAQWCIFDPIISAIYGISYQDNGDISLLSKQTHYFNRALGQLTSSDFHLGGFKCPELYYLQDGQYIPNDATPLLWTQANLLTALTLMNKSLRKYQTT